MVTSTPNVIGDSFTPVANADDAAVMAGGAITVLVTNVFTNSPGLLANDEAVPGGNGFSLEIIGVGLSPVDIQSAMTVTSGYGQWQVNRDGGYTYIADGLASKMLADGETKTDVLYYLVKNGSDQTAIGQLSMNITGTYDAPEVNFGLPRTITLTEDEWRQEVDVGGGLNVSLPLVRVNFAEDPSAIRVQIQTDLIFYPADLLQVFGDQINEFSTKISATYNQTYDGAINFTPSVNVLPYYLDFLRPGDQIKISTKMVVSDGVTTFVSSPSFLTIDGVNHPIFLNPDKATVMQGQVIEVPTVGSVFDNDVDPDGQGVMRVLGFASTLQNTVGVLPDGSFASIEGYYGTLKFDCYGHYGYVPFPEYRYTLDTLTDIFQYSAINEAIDANWGELTIEILPDPDIQSLVPMEDAVFVLDEGLAVIGESQPVENGYFMRTVLGGLSIESPGDALPKIDIFYERFTVSSSENQALFFDAVVRAGLVEPFVELIERTEPVNGVWTARYDVGLDSMTDFQSLTGYDQIALFYVIRGTDQQMYSGAQLIQVIIFGENDAPVAAEDRNIVYAGQSAVGITGSVSGLLFNDHDVDFNDELHVSNIRFGDTEISFAEQTSDPFQPLILEGVYGWLYVYSDGSYQYTASKPEAQAIEPISDTVGPTYEIFTYRVIDKDDAWDEQQLVIQVLGPSDKPTALDDTVVMYLDSQDSGKPVYNLFINDLDTDPSRIRLASTTNFPGDFLRLNERGDIFLQASALDYLKFGEDLNLFFNYTSSNGVAESESGSVHVQIIGKNEAPQGHNDVYFYENIVGSIFEIDASDGLILRVHVSDEIADSDIDGDVLMIAAVSETTLDSGLPVTWVMLDEGAASLTLPGDITLIMHSNGSFLMDAPDGYTGIVEFAYLLSDGTDFFGAKATIIVGGPASLDGYLLINEISLQNGTVVRNVYTDNGAAPNRIAVGAASIELLNTSDEAISAVSLATLKLEIAGPEGSMTTLSLGDLTGFTVDASGHALHQLSIPAGGLLMLYEPGSLGLGTWALYGPNRSFIAGASGSYEGQAWPLGGMAEEAIAVNLVQGGTSVDFFAANGADTEMLTGIIGLGDSAQAEQGIAGVPWAGDDVGLLSEEQYDGMMSSAADTVFGRTSFTDTDSELDWSYYVFQARTVGATNTKLALNAPRFVANPEDPTENLNPNQGLSTSEGQDKQIGSGSVVGGGGYDVLIGQAGADSLFGDELDDALHGGAGDDSLDGGSGGDWLEGGAGADQLRGGSGRDVFVFAAVTDSGLGSSDSRDMILDFTVSEDRIDLSMIDANAALEGNQAFEWGGVVSGRLQAATVAGKVVCRVENGMTLVQVEVAGDNLAPLELVINGVKAPSVADFIL